MTMKKPPQRLVNLRPWLWPPKISTWLEPLSMTTSVEPPPRLGLTCQLLRLQPVPSALTSAMQQQKPHVSRTNCGSIARTLLHSARNNLGFVRISIAEVVGVLVVKQRDVLFVSMERLPARIAVWLLHVGHYEDNHTASTKLASMFLMQPSRHLIVPWFKCRGLFERKPVWLGRAVL